MDTRTLRPWTDLTALHPDVEAGRLTEATFAIDLGAIASGDPNVPSVYRDAEAFFRATYLTPDLKRLIDETLASLAGRDGFNRVLKLRAPFGGGKSHTLASLFHSARNRRALDHLPEAAGLSDPGPVAVAVFDGEKFDARDGKAVKGDLTIQTIWGWIAWQIDPERAFPMVAGHDRDRVAPGGDVIRDVLTRGAGGRPVLLLLDEVLKYMERASAVAVLDSTLQRQAKDFFQNLTVEVAGSRNAAMVYSLTWSSREALGNVALLAEIDKLAARVDQLREPVTGDDVLRILRRRLLRAAPDTASTSDIANEYATTVAGLRHAYADNEADHRQADEIGDVLRGRIAEAYPFHPALIDLMRERWTAIDAFQRTRGALRFLASCLYSLKANGGAKPLLGPAEIPLKDTDVRVKLLKELGAQNDYDPVITADIEGAGARAKRIDERLARETPALASVRPATRLATAILMYSFGGLKRDGGGGETLPPGVTESDLLDACVGPDLDKITATSVLGELRTACLYLHFDGVHYCFKKDPNVTKLVEDAEQEVAREDASAKDRGPVRSRIRDMLDEKLAGKPGAIVWPAKSQDIPDGEPQFQLGFLPLEVASEPPEWQAQHALTMFGKFGDRPRKYRNGLGVVVPDARPVEALRRAVRYLIAVERVEAKKTQYRLTKDQLDQLAERRRTEKTAAESALRDLYSAVWLPVVEKGEITIQRVEKGGRPLQAAGIHERVTELLTSQGSPKVHTTLYPAKVIERMHLGKSVAEAEPARLGVTTTEIVDAFFSFVEPPRLESSKPVRDAIVRGVTDGTLAYLAGAKPDLGDDGKYRVNLSKVFHHRAVRPDEVDLDSGFVFLPEALPSAATVVPVPPGPGTGPGNGPGPQPPVVVPPPVPPPPKPGQARQDVRLDFEADREQVFKSFRAIAALAEKADGGKVAVTVTARSAEGFDPTWLRNAVEEPLDEADIERK